MWDRISTVILQCRGDFICVVGDYNSIRSLGERRGRSEAQNRRDINKFDGFIRGSNLLDMPIQGRKFTYYKPDGTCKSRLDRALVNNEWLEQWPSASLKGLLRSISDHCPILLGSTVRNWGPKPFRFINAWTSHPQFKNFVESTWKSYQVQGWGGFVIKEKLKLLKEDLKKWNHEVFGNIDKKIGELKNEIRDLDIEDEAQGLEEGDIIRRKEATAALFRNLHQKNNLVAQKAKIRWLKEGDVNSSFFHRAINFRRKSNEIPGIMLDGVWTEEVQEVKRGIHDFFKKQFSSSRIIRSRLLASQNERRLSEEDNQFLIAPFSESEVVEAITNCESSKSPGPDGFNFKFIKEHWQTIREDIMRMFAEFHRFGKLVNGLNHSFVVLIPKKEEAISLKDYRPISLISCVYKILSKVLAARMSRFVNKIISDHQSAFIGNRFIMDGVVVLNEVINEARKKKMERLIFKIDFAKAYDSVEWSFLDNMLEFFEFDRVWRKWIMECVSTAHISVLVNGSPSGDFKMERGLRQGDPLSPFLYLLVAEGLSILVNRAVDFGILEAAEVGRDKVRVSHLQYADDTVFVSSGKESNSWAMKWILRNFEILSGLKVNF